MPSAACSHTVTLQFSLLESPASSCASGRMTARTLSPNTALRWRAAWIAIGTSCGSAWRSLSEPNRFAEPAASRMATTFKPCWVLLHRPKGRIGARVSRPSSGSVTPWRTAVISARIATAISGGVFEPMYRPTGPLQARDLALRQVEFLQPQRAARRCSSSSRWRRRRTPATSAPPSARGRRSSGRASSATTALWPSRFSRATTSSGMPRSSGTPGEVPAVGVLLARIDHQHVVVEHARHLGEIARELAGADEQQAPARAVHGGQHLAVEFEHVLPAARAASVTRPLSMSRRRAHELLLARWSRAARRTRFSRSPAPSRVRSVPPQGRPQRVASSLVTP